jgi:sterol desaturase/sphingolipid hydroxylase (fatty acid hydroxylase superfamily)
MASIDSNYPYAQGTPLRFEPPSLRGRPPARLRKWGRFILMKEAEPTKAWCGVLAITAFCSWLGVVGFQSLMSTGSLSFAVSSARARAVGPTLLVFVGVILLAERLWPAVPRPLLSKAHLVDAGYLALFAIVVMPLLTLVESGFATEISRHAHFLMLSRLPIGPQVVGVSLILIGIDAMNWAGHVANHRWLTLWRLHALHHSQEDMSVLTTFRTHPLIHASYLPSLFPALILGASGTVPGVALIFYGCLITLPHANLRWTFGPFGRVFISPAYHRLHHAAVFLDERGTVNFGFVLVCWDQVIHRAAFPTNEAPIATGLTGRPVPVEQGVSTRSTPRVMVAQLAQPFTKQAATDGPAS